MGNKAVVSVVGSKVGVYLHWNGGPESINAFLRVAKDLGVPPPESDTSYFYARFVQIVGNFFGGVDSVGIESLDKLDLANGDNGHYIVDKQWRVVNRKFAPPIEHPYRQEYEDSVYAACIRINEPVFERDR